MNHSTANINYTSYSVEEYVCEYGKDNSIFFNEFGALWLASSSTQLDKMHNTNFYITINDHEYILTNFFMYIKICSTEHTQKSYFTNINLNKSWIFHVIWIHALATTVSHTGYVEICDLAHFKRIHASDKLLSIPLMSLSYMKIIRLTPIPLPSLHQKEGDVVVTSCWLLHSTKQPLNKFLNDMHSQTSKQSKINSVCMNTKIMPITWFALHHWKVGPVLKSQTDVTLCYFV
jgi:hypothetical protein